MLSEMFSHLCLPISSYMAQWIGANSNLFFAFCIMQAGIGAAPQRAAAAIKEMNIPQKFKDIKLPDMPNFKFWC